MEGLVWGGGGCTCAVLPHAPQKWLCLLELSDEGEIGDI